MTLKFNVGRFTMAIRDRRTELGMTQTKAAKAVKLSLAMFHRIENDKNTPKLDTYGRICSWLQRSPADFYDEQGG